MTVKITGKVESIICDQCAQPCESNVIEISTYRVDQLNGSAINHFCSSTCFEEYLEIPEKINSGCEREIRRECGKMHKVVCPKCTSRLEKFFREEECREDL